MFFPCRTLLVALLAALISISALAQDSSKRFGDYEVHYSVLNSTFLEPETAAGYGITRGKNHALINIAVRKHLPDGSNKAQKAIVRGKSSDLIHASELEFTEIVEQEAIYYIAGLRFNDKELRTFEIKVQPDPNIKPYGLKFNKTLYAQ